jgi:hypothetical protein
MEIHLSKPGGQREGPYTLEQINRDLELKKYRSTEYWAWHEGLPQWVPLHALPGVADRWQPPPVPVADPVMDEGAHTTVVTAPEDLAEPGMEMPDAPVVAAAPESKPEEAAAASGLPFSALEQIFILSTGQGQPASRSTVTVKMLEQIIGEDVETIRSIVPRDVIAECKVLEGMRGQGAIPGSVWRAMTAFKPDLLQQAREGSHRIIVRSFEIDTGDLVCLFLFYSKAKL